MLFMRRSVLLVIAMLLGCRKDAPPPPPDPVASATPSASTPKLAPFVECGPLECRAYRDFATAFEATLIDGPRVVAIGEAHAKKGLEWVDTSAKRFTAEIVPRLKGRASDLLLELMAPAQGCETAKKETQKQLGKIGKDQQVEAPNELVTLGKAAEKEGIKVSQLHPTCKDFAAIAQSKSPPLTVLQTITTSIVRDTVAALKDRPVDKLFVIYGGAFHTEPSPPPERAEFSVASEVAKAAGGKYASVHVFVREYIDQTWDIWEWYPQFKPNEHRDDYVLLHPKPQHWVLITAAAKRSE